ncbi:MAG: hypothetical protein A3F84_24095 [Candidatus Handelsmanbacteria bacterium RIFCSPLOWO2_12_FULL_64_10]|uniref:Uncharacterized protein n=1 Tax=Handelsmanbacteria sp. (strain RIFCSPLOWO2_12_FULL_64_10) TaxID=1817868 RepID=A0A1F6CCL9_HANXR|nr:MAG: hypothetical protein A3F84_24095 [Candidatus Handelsmanbacteria bacterium RIFCSPLOWO2_12_FULL_64_10]
MGIAERIYEIVKSLPEAAAAEVLDYAENERAKTAAKSVQTDRRNSALALLDRHAGKFKTVKFSRADLYDRACLR